MIRDLETLNLLLDSVRRFVREQLVPPRGWSTKPTKFRQPLSKA